MQLPRVLQREGSDTLPVTQHLLLQLSQFDGFRRGECPRVLTIDQVATALVLRLRPALVSIRGQGTGGDDPGDGLAVQLKDRAGRIKRNAEEKLPDRLIDTVKVHVRHYYCDPSS